MQCEKCRDEIPNDESHLHEGMHLCDDCYMDAMQPVTGCDPWATYLATRTEQSDQAYSSVQRKILNLTEEQDYVEVSELLETTGLDEIGLQKEVATLKHMQKVNWAKRSDGRIVLQSYKPA